MTKKSLWSNKLDNISQLLLIILLIVLPACTGKSLGGVNSSEVENSSPIENNDTEEGHRQPPDLSEAAKKLGVSEDELAKALGSPPPDFEAAADKLGVSVKELKDALPPSPERSPW